MSSGSAYDVLQASWVHGLSHVQLAAVLAEFAAPNPSALSASLAAGFCSFAARGELPGPVLGYLTFSIRHGLIQAADLFDALIECASENHKPGLNSLTAILREVDPTTPEELLSRLRLLATLRPLKLKELSKAISDPFSRITDPLLLPVDIRTAMLDLIGDAPELELKTLAARLDLKVPLHSAIVQPQAQPQVLPVEIWQGIEGVLTAGGSIDAELLLSNLVSLRCSRTGASAIHSAVAQLYAHINAQFYIRRDASSNRGDVLSAALLDLFLVAAKLCRRHRPQTSRAFSIWSTFVYVRLPLLLARAARTRPHIAGPNIESAWSASCAEALRRLRDTTAGMTPSAKSEAMDTDAPTPTSTSPKEMFFRALVSGLHEQQFVTDSFLQEVGIEPFKNETSDLSGLKNITDLDGALEKLQTALVPERADGLAIGNQIASLLTEWAATKQVARLSTFATALASDVRILDILFVHLPPSSILAPVASVIEQFDAGTDSQGFEHFGRLSLFLQTVTHRYALGHDLIYSLGADKDFCLRWLSSSASAFHLKSLSAAETALVSSWIAALYSESGISDVLVSETNPRMLLYLAPTILQQSVVARKLGIISPDTLKDGLSYFTQELLSFSLPGVLKWIAAELGRLPSSSALTAILQDVLSLLVSAPSTPHLALQIAAPDLQGLGSLDASVKATIGRIITLPAAIDTQPEHVDALAALHGGSKSALLPALRAVLLSARAKDLATLAQSVALSAAALSLPSLKEPVSFPFLEHWVPKSGDELRAVAAQQRAQTYESTMAELDPNLFLESRALQVKERWTILCSNEVNERMAGIQEAVSLSSK